MNFLEVSLMARRTGVCPICKRRTVKSKRFAQTVNPFNRNADGSVRTSRQVLDAVAAERQAWVPDFTHEACR